VTFEAMSLLCTRSWRAIS